jgi:hypothetical protein
MQRNDEDVLWAICKANRKVATVNFFEKLLKRGLLLTAKRILEFLDVSSKKECLLTCLKTDDRELLNFMFFDEDFSVFDTTFLAETMKKMKKKGCEDSFKFLRQMFSRLDCDRMFRDYLTSSKLNKELTKIFIERYEELTVDNVIILTMTLEARYEKLLGKVSDMFIVKACSTKNLDVIDVFFYSLVDQQKTDLIEIITDGLYIFDPIVKKSFIDHCKKRGNETALKFVLAAT